MKNFRITFYKLDKEKNDKGVETVNGKKQVGTVVVDDSGVGPNLTLVSKGFRHAGELAQLSDSIRVEEITL